MVLSRLEQDLSSMEVEATSPLRRHGSACSVPHFPLDFGPGCSSRTGLSGKPVFSGLLVRLRPESNPVFHPIWHIKPEQPSLMVALARLVGESLRSPGRRESSRRSGRGRPCGACFIRGSSEAHRGCLASAEERNLELEGR
ncbi:hypothetical protein Nepgr_033967 [Nepenthes gracilis]|uniref:Uncharacterized protein n=1 Tax=Nepenthes gracilis TaxID=150966 RepID=A0AAD3TN69_NEPGR|nr:hypothetical protein Nepgr_033967 [Nepenthes gracilis]